MEETGKLRVLLVEDDPDDANLVGMMLKTPDEGSFEIEIEDTLAKALERLKERRFDVILLDLMLPDSLGFPTFSKIQAEAFRLPIVVLARRNDETIAVRAVEKGAQDYLVKGQVSSNNLRRTVRQAIARQAGERKKITSEELKAFDGLEGRPAYFVYKGKIFDVSASKLWKSGLHAGRHSPGKDLTEELRNAPHGEEVLAKIAAVGDLVAPESPGYRLLAKLERMHPHPITVHFAIAYSIAVSALSLLYLLTENIFFERASYYILGFGVPAALLAAVSGLLSWKISYEGKKRPVFRNKITYSIILIAVLTAAFISRTANQNILIEETALKYTYLIALMSLAPTVTFLGRLGGKITHP